VQIVPELTPGDAESLVEKKYGDPFEDTILETVLSGLRRDPLQGRLHDGRSWRHVLKRDRGCQGPPAFGAPGPE
jgi:hypothetical protein